MKVQHYFKGLSTLGPIQIRVHVIDFYIFSKYYSQDNQFVQRNEVL